MRENVYKQKNCSPATTRLLTGGPPAAGHGSPASYAAREPSDCASYIAR